MAQVNRAPEQYQWYEGQPERSEFAGPYPGIQLMDPSPQAVVQPTEDTAPAFEAKISEERWTWCNLITAVVSAFFCYALGLIAIVFSILAYIEHTAKQFERSKSKKNAALWLSIAAIISGLLILSITLAVRLSNTHFYT